MGYADQYAKKWDAPGVLDNGGAEYNVLHIRFNTTGMEPDGTNDFTAVIQAAYDALPAAGGIVRIPAGTYLIDPDTSILPPSNSTTILSRGAILRAVPTTSGVSQVVNIDGVSNVLIAGDGIIEGDKYTHDLSTSLVSTTLTTALTGGETTLEVASTVGMDSGNRNLVVVADDGTYAFAVYAVDDGTHLSLQTAIPAGFVASIGQGVHQASGEGGMCIRIDNSTDVVVRDVTCRKAWGDGIYVTEYDRASDVGTKRVLIENVNCDDNRRQGISIVGGRYVTIRGGIFQNTQGAQPQHGIDIEPSSTYSCDDVLIDGALCTGNERDGIRVLPDGDTVRRLRIVNAHSVGNVDYGLSLFRGSTAVLVEGGTYADNGDSGIIISCSASVASHENSISGVSVVDNGGYGIEVDGSLGGGLERTFISAERVTGNNSGGVEVNTADFTQIVKVAAQSTGDHGIRVQNSEGVSVRSCQASGALVTGIRMVSCTNGKVSDCSVTANERSGVVLETCTECGIQGGEVIGNSQETHNTYDNIVLGGTNNFVRDVLVRRGSGATQARRGIDVTATGSGVLIDRCDLRTAGATSSLVNAGTGTVIRDNIGYSPPTTGVTFADADTTPDVTAQNGFYYVNNTGATTITAFDGGVDGQEIRLFFNNANTTISHGTIRLAGSANVTPTANSWMRFYRRNGLWYEQSRAVA